jgi:Uma2 family endonuclease
MKKMGVPQKKDDRNYTYNDYCSWPEDERWELIEGTAYDMSPAPSWNHQEISAFIFTKLYNFLEKQPCKVFAAPFDVLLPVEPVEKEGKINTVVQPDISIICDPRKKTEKGCLGAPDLIVEILSPSTSKKDLNEKFRLYEKHRVKEYWIVDPGNKYIRIFHLQKGADKKGQFDDGTLIPPANWRDENTIAESRLFKGFSVDVKELFESLD